MINKSALFFIASIDGKGGAEKNCKIFAKKFTEQGYSIQILTLNQKYQNDNLEGIDISCLEVNKARFALYYFAKYYFKHKPQIIVCFDYETSFLVTMLKLVFRHRFLYVFRNINTVTNIRQVRRNYIYNFLYLLLLKLTFKVSDRIISQCLEMKEDIIKNFPNSKDKIKVIYNTCDETLISNEDLNNKFDFVSKQYFLIVGRLEIQKAIDESIDAFKLFSLSNNEVKLVILGEGSLKNQIELKVSQLGLQNRVYLLGNKSNINQFYENAIATILTSKYEGFPNVLLESISYGTPIIAFNCPGGISEIIINGVNGFIVSNRSVIELSEKMKLLNEYPLDTKLVKNTSEKFQMKKVFPEIEAFIFS